MPRIEEVSVPESSRKVVVYNQEVPKGKAWVTLDKDEYDRIVATEVAQNARELVKSVNIAMVTGQFNWSESSELSVKASISSNNVNIIINTGCSGVVILKSCLDFSRFFCQGILTSVSLLL